MNKILLIFAILGASISFSNAECVSYGPPSYNYSGIVCNHLQDGDLPGAVESFSGHYNRLALNNNKGLTILNNNSFPRLYFDVVGISNNENLETIEHNFLQGGEAAVKQLQVYGNYQLK